MSMESALLCGYNYQSMLSISHMATGALIASYLPNPALYIPLTLASHYLEDFILHWDVGTGLSSGKKKKKAAIIHEFIELGISFVFLYLVFEQHRSGISWHVWIAAIVALIPDFMEAPRNFFGKEPAFLKPFNNFHHRFHHSTPNVILGLTPQILLLLVILIASPT